MREKRRENRDIGTRNGFFLLSARPPFPASTASSLPKTQHAKQKTASRSYGLLPTSIQGRAEQDPATWITEGFAACKEAVGSLDAESRKSIAAVAVSGQQHGSVFLGASGEVLRPAKLWCDTETAAEAEELSRKMGEAVVPAFTAPKVAWLSANEPGTADRVSCVCLPHDYVNMVLSGDSRPVSEAGDASGTGYWNVEARKFDLSKAALVDARLPSWLPSLISSPDAAIGTVCAAASELTGLPVGIPVAPGSGDNACAALGVGAVVPGESKFFFFIFSKLFSPLFSFFSLPLKRCFEPIKNENFPPGDWVVSLGTSGTLFGPSASPPQPSPSGAIARFCDATGQWMPLLCTLNCTVPAEQVRKAWGLTHDAAAELATAAAAKNIGKNGGVGSLTFLPYLAGERTPNWPWAKGCVLGLDPSTLESPEAAAGNLYLSALEGATFSLLAGLRAMPRSSSPPRSVILVGGGARSDLWTRIVADSFGLPVSRPSEPEAAALGAALQAAAVAEGAKVGEFVSATADEVRRAGANSSISDSNSPSSSSGATEPDLSKREAYDEAFESTRICGRRCSAKEAGSRRKCFWVEIVFYFSFL